MDNALSVHEACSTNVLARADLEKALVLVVDDSGRYVGALLRGHAVALEGNRAAIARLRGLTLVSDAMESLPAVHERDTVFAVARAMVSKHVRALPVVNDDGIPVGVVHDLSILGFAAHTPSGMFKRCTCGHLYSAEEWSRLRAIGPMDDGRRGILELRQCEHCHSTLAVVFG